MRKIIWPTLWMLLALGLMLGLGTWQLQRKAWKEGLIARIEGRVHAAPVSLEAALAQWQQTRDVEYLRVSVRGRFLHDKEMDLYSPAESGPGWQIFTPLEVDGAGLLIVNRGFVPDALKAAASRAAGQPNGETEVVGLVRLPGARTRFVPENEPAKNVWYWRDLLGMLRIAMGPDRNTERPYVPFFIDAEASPPNPGGWPKGGTTLLSLPNRHLEYALTWYGLGLALVGVYGLFIKTRFKGGVDR